MRIISLLTICTLTASWIFAQNNITGKWYTIDDTGKHKSTVEINIRNGRLYGRIIDLENKAYINNLCTECLDYRKGQKIVGMNIITGLTKNNNIWEGDNGILDPENGKIYDVKIWLEEDKLMVRGYIGFIYRTQTWIRPNHQ